MAQWTISTVLSTPADKTGKGEVSAGGAAPTQQAGNAKSTPKPLVVLEQTFTKTHDIMRMEYVDEAKLKWTVWSASGFQILVSPDGKGCGEVAVSLVKDIPNPFQINFAATDFPGFEWISAANYLDVT